MKKIYLILSVFALVFTACETDFEVNAEWEETTVVFSLLDKAKEIQFVKINKAFLGEADALQMAQHSDSSNYNPNDLSVKLYQSEQVSGIFDDTISSFLMVDNQLYKLLDSLVLYDTIIEKDDGLFSTENNIVYYFNSSIVDNFLSSNRTYSLVIKNNITGNSVSSTTEIIKGFNFSQGIPNSDRLTFYVDGLGYRFPRFEWSSANSPNAEIFQFNLRFHYKENEVEKELLWTQTALGSNANILILSGEDFYHQFLANNLEALDDDVEREFINIDIEMTLGTQDLKTYIAVNEPITGIVQERPQFTNINNGIGLFSSRYTKVYSGLSLNPDSEKYIIEELGLNFK